MAREWWEGGYFTTGKNGRASYVIEREVGGVRHHVSTRCSTRRAALEQLGRFEANPSAYVPAGEKPSAPRRLTAELLEEFRQWQLNGKGVTARHAYYTGIYLADWIEDLGGVDLRNVTLKDHVDPALVRRIGAKPKRIAALKVFYGWMRTQKRLLVTADDCTLDLLVPQARPEKRRRKKAVDQLLVQKVLGKLPDRYRDVLLFMACTGWHITEVQRFARDARSELVELTPEAVLRDGCLAVAKTWHKGKLWTVTPIVTQQHLEAARRIRERATFPRWFNVALKKVALELGGDLRTGAPYYFPLGVMRHSFATWHVQKGADAKRVSVALDQKDERTARDFYIDVDVPRSDLPAITFELPSIPTLH